MKFPRTKAALQLFTQRLPELDRKFATVQSNEELETWVKIHKAAEDTVREAFWMDTRAFNTHDNCMLISIQELMGLVGREEARCLK